MRPQAFKKISYSFLPKNIKGASITWEHLSFIFLYIDLFCFVFFSISVLSTHQRILDFFNEGVKGLPYATRLLLSITSYEYMGVCTLAGIFLIIKERMPDKRRACIINVSVLVATWIMVFFYIWGMSLPFSH